MKRACWVALRYPRCPTDICVMMMIRGSSTPKASDASGWRSQLSHPGFLPVLHPLGGRAAVSVVLLLHAWPVCDLLAGRPMSVVEHAHLSRPSIALKPKTLCEAQRSSNV